MGVGKSVIGICIVEITSASIADTLTAINNDSIHLRHISYCDDLHVRAEVYRLDIQRLQLCLSRNGAEMKITEKKGMYWTLSAITGRPVLAIGMLLFLILTLYLPSKILFVRVEGNKNVPIQLILEKAESCGIKFGASRREIRSEKVKNALLSKLPQLQWVGINTAGCVAVISVQERADDSASSRASLPGNIVATRDGIIKDIVVLQGNPLCKIGQAVKAGQVLVSGYTDCGFIIKVTPPEAEIKALTQRDLCTVTPVEYQIRSCAKSETRRYLLRIGKNIINFCKYSGISDTRCVKMYEEKFMVLPGGFQLPVSIITERSISYDSNIAATENSRNLSWMEAETDNYLQTQIKSGQILSSGKLSNISGGLFYLDCTYSCDEMIGEVREEEFVLYNGKTN